MSQSNPFDEKDHTQKKRMRRSLFMKSSDDCNAAVFEAFYEDLQNDNLPEIPDPTQEEIEEYTRKREERPNGSDRSAQYMRSGFSGENSSIPVEVEIWVDKVCDYYFHDLVSVLGLVHRCEDAKQALYKSRGYHYYRLRDRNSGVCVD